MKKEIEISAPKGYSFKEVRDGKVVFEQDVLPTSWEEYCENYPVIVGECYVDTESDIITFDEGQSRDSVQDENVIKNEKTAEAILALNKLIHLRDVYRDGWLPNWRDIKEKKYGIGVFLDRVYPDTLYAKQHILSFQTIELRDMFLGNFQDLIKQAKELL